MSSDWRESREYDRWQRAVIRRDGSCQVPGCGSKEHLQAHHTNHATYFPEDRYITKKGKTMCERCHSNYHNNYHNNTREKCTTKDWLNFWSLMQYAASLHMYRDKEG